MTQQATGPKAGATSWVHTVHLDRPSFEDNTADVDRLLRALRRESGLADLVCDVEVMSQVPNLLRDNDFAVRCTLFSDGQRAVVTMKSCACLGIVPAACSSIHIRSVFHKSGEASVRVASVWI